MQGGVGLEPLGSAATTSTGRFVDATDAALALRHSLNVLRAAAGRVVQAVDAQEVGVLRVRVPGLEPLFQEAGRLVRETALGLEATPIGFTISEGYAERLESEFRHLNLEFDGQFPEYELFPLTVRVQPEHETVRIGRKTVQTLDPHAVARLVQTEQRRLHRSSFNADRFLRALSLCYDALSRGQLGTTVALIEVYRLLSARTGAAGYTRQEFAFDIYRVRRQSELVVDGRKVEFVHGKKGARISVPRSQGGVEEFTGLVMTQVFGHA